MKNIIILRGFPASGKSTWAVDYVKQHPGAVRINCDSLRNMMGWMWLEEKEPIVWHLFRDVLCSLVACSKVDTILIDNINIRPQSIAEIVSILDIWAEDNYHISYQYFDVDLDVLLDRNSKRDRSVPEDYIKQNYENYHDKVFIEHCGEIER